MNRKTTNTIQNTTTGTIMTVTGKHKEILIELLMYYLANSRYGMNEEFLTTTIEDIKKRNMASDYWIKEFIDAPNVFSRY